MNKLPSEKIHTAEERIRAAYALNMCTVSLSQIIDYHDAYILEQEYDAILNNLNLKQMPKDEALLRILSELLNTITYFRIQNIKKEQIEKKYAYKIKNAMWSAIPNISMIVSGNPVAIAFSLATQIGCGYLNYRREKANAQLEKDDALIELEITAIEQFNAIKRELFTTAWRLADEYDFDDHLRLTEKQILQYNEILMDPDPFRKYVRLEAISQFFEAYPPFWYYYGHTANYIAEDARIRRLNNNYEKKEAFEKKQQDKIIEEQYTKLAEEHFEKYYQLCRFNILREDILTSQFAIEYVDLLYKHQNKDFDKINHLLEIATSMSPNSFDILQLCALSYLKIGNSKQAIPLLKKLVYENYNSSVNAKLLSRLYASEYLQTSDQCYRDHLRADYRLLDRTLNNKCLFPFPEINGLEETDDELQDEYASKMAAYLKKTADAVIYEFVDSYTVPYYQVWMNGNLVRGGSIPDDRFKLYEKVISVLDSDYAKEYMLKLQKTFKADYIAMINRMISELNELTIFSESVDRIMLLKSLEEKLKKELSVKMKNLNDKLKNGSMDSIEFNSFSLAFSPKGELSVFFDAFQISYYRMIDSLEECFSDKSKLIEYLNKLEMNMLNFCLDHSLNIEQNRIITDTIKPKQINTFDLSCFGNEKDDNQIKDLKELILKKIRDSADALVNTETSSVNVILCDRDKEQFEEYFCNIEDDTTWLQENAIAVLDDSMDTDNDLVFSIDGVRLVTKNNIHHVCEYKYLVFVNNSYYDGGNQYIRLSSNAVYQNKDVNMNALEELLYEIRSIKMEESQEESMLEAVEYKNVNELRRFRRKKK